jgi:hypothetical protein
MIMKRFVSYSLSTLFALAAFSIGLTAQVGPLQLSTTETVFNRVSERGMPVSSDPSDPDSDGRAPPLPAYATPGQFKGFIAFGGIVSPRPTVDPLPTDHRVYAADALPRATDGVTTLYLARAQVGAPYFGRQVSFLFGSVVHAPATDIEGDPLQPGVTPGDYWLREPFSPDNHATARYYWSPHARAVFAVYPGPVSITWRRAAPESPQPPTLPAPGDPNFVTVNGLVYAIRTEDYIVSASPVKPQRRIYWTEGSFRNTGITIDVPDGVTTNFIYTPELFPATVEEAYVAPGSSPPVAPGDGEIFTERRTIFFNQDTGKIHAYNWEGRILMELLGDSRDGGRHEFLGTEIVDVIRRVNPGDVTVELGEKLTAWQDGAQSDGHLLPAMLNRAGSNDFVFTHYVTGRRVDLYAVRETRQTNDFLLHWMDEGLEGIRWPLRFIRYKMVWPDAVGKYSHYVRPPAATEEEARRTAVPLPTDNVPILQYQDALDKPRAKLTETLAFYTWLDEAYPAHRTLLRFTSGEEVAFERVFSWLGDSLSLLEDGDYAASHPLRSFIHPPSVGGNQLPPVLSSWDPQRGVFAWAGVAFSPRIVASVVPVGRRIEPPQGLSYAPMDGGYWAGFIRQEVGTSYQPDAYINPFAGGGFAAANRGAIIPVNAIPGENQLEVWWFRSNNSNVASGFRAVHWPSVIGKYTIEWPANPPEIVLASNHGSGPLGSLEAKGRIYYQNTRTQPGYNPNEEHALMIGGHAYALRDDLNITAGSGYSSEPFVLVAYEAADGRPDMTAFRVLREKPDAGWVFDYVVKAGTMLQPPMPLGLLPPPVAGVGANAQNFNTEPPHDSGDLPGRWDEASAGVRAALKHYQGFTYRDRKETFWIYRGLHSGTPPLEGGTYDHVSDSFGTPREARVFPGETFNYAIHASHQLEALVLKPAPGTALPSGLSIVGATITGAITEPVELHLVLTSTQSQAEVGIHLPLLLADEENVHFVQDALRIESLNPYTGSLVEHVGRPPYLAVSPAPGNSFSMRFYYKTLPGFAWPGLSPAPATGSIVPYLRPIRNGAFDGAPDKSATASLDIVYRPTWPLDTPIMLLGDTLSEAKSGLPAVRGETSLQILYDQSVARDIVTSDVAVILHDSTREKEYPLSPATLSRLPDGVRAELYQGRVFFPNLPPHLVERFFFDPNRGDHGHLVFKGIYTEEEYLLLNVLRGENDGDDLAAVKALCPEGDANKTHWDTAIEGLTTLVETFRENLKTPGTFEPNPTRNRYRGIDEIVVIDDHNTAVDSYALSASGPGFGYVTLMAGGGAAFTPAGETVSLRIIQVVPELHPGKLKVIAATNPLNESVTMQHTADLGGRFDEYIYDWRIGAPVDGLPPVKDAGMTQWINLASGAALPRYTLGGANIRTLSDNYIVMRYRPNNPSHPLYVEAPTEADWSPWTEPQLAEGWIKRVLAGINPFQQRITDLFNNRVDTNVSMLTQAGKRWEGDVALNLENINDFGLIEIYETVLRRGRMLSIDAGINYGPANDALLLAAGYLNDLYMFVGNEAWADAANPTIGIGTADHTYGDIATAMFAFKGQVATLLEEELALMRGRDDFLLPGARFAPVYNRLVWNYTRGIDAGEVIYAINYNVQEKPDGQPNGIIGADDAARMFPQGHGDAYGHYLTALKNYYSLMMNPSFDWVPRIEAVLVLGQPVSVDYLDERKFASAAASVARAGKHTFDLTWRQDYKGGEGSGWQHFGRTRSNGQRGTTRHWGMDHWATRTGTGAYLNWVVGNAILPAEDPDPTHEGIQKIDRVSVPELTELVVVMDGLQTALNNAEGGLTPLGLPEGGIAFDINPSLVTGSSSQTHFEQIYDRAVKALRNAVAAFDDAKDVTRLMRSEQDTLSELQNQVAKQELAYKHALIELYGTPYPDEIGPGRTYRAGYDGPDLLYYMYVDLPELPQGYAEARTYRIDLQGLPSDWQSKLYTDAAFFTTGNSSSYILNNHYVDYHYSQHGFFGKPEKWTGRRRAPGRAQQAISELIAAHERVGQALYDAEAAKKDLDKALALFEARVNTDSAVRKLENDLLIAKQTLDSVKLAFDFVDLILGRTKETVTKIGSITADALPSVFVAGLASGGDLTSGARAAIKLSGGVVEESIDWLKIAKFIGVRTFEFGTETSERWVQFDQIAPMVANKELREQVLALGNQLHDVQGKIVSVNEALRVRDDAERKYRSTVAEGDRILEEREVFRRRSASLVHGYRSRDAAFRIFRQEKLERYKTLFDLSAQYALLAANAYDYETGLLGTTEGRAFVSRIVAARALGIVRDGQPQFAGSATGDPGLSSALAEMKADWDVLKGRLGFNNADGYGTTVSLRRENFRIRPGEDGDAAWRDVLQKAWRRNLLEDADVRRYAMQLGTDGYPVPGLVVTFRTTIAPGRNLFGNRLAAGDHNYSPSSFATKIFAAGVALEGYVGMSDPGSTTSSVAHAEGNSPDEPVAYWFDENALAATPYVYLIPVGYDSMRTPPLGDTSQIRVWNVRDVTVPLPFNVGASQFSTLQWWQSSDFLTESMFSVRKHQAFRPVSSASVFSYNIYSGGSLASSQFTNSRLIGRSVWNSEWKLIIPGDTLLADPEEGLQRFIRTVNDIKLHFVTYSYSGN